MSDTETAVPGQQPEDAPVMDKGKGKAVEAEAENESSDESDNEVQGDGQEDEPVWHTDDTTAGTSNTSTAAATLKGPPKNGDWQAIWSAQYNAYYFHNSKTNVTTWENPITSTKPIPTAPVNPLKRPADALEGIDPDLAYLDPSLSNPLGPQGKFNATARFNARTGKFEADPEKNPDRVSDFNRAKRQNAFFFDVDGWEKQKAEENMAKMKAEAEGRVEKKKKPTKAELERYKARAAEKKHARRMAWLAD